MVGRRVAPGLVEEAPPLSEFRTGLIWIASGQLVVYYTASSR